MKKHKSFIVVAIICVLVNDTYSQKILGQNKLSNIGELDGTHT